MAGVRRMTKRSGHRIDPEDYPGLSEHPIGEVRLENEEATRRLGEALAQVARDGDFIALVGELGAGKTTLMQGLVRAVAPTDRWKATSPTYALIQIYETEPRIHHMDLYRLEGWSDLESIGYWDYAESRRGITCVEWLDRIPAAWPGRGLIVELLRSKRGRVARLWGDGRWRRRLDGLCDEVEREDEESDDER